MQLASHHTSFSQHPLALLAAALAVGILSAHSFSIPLATLLVCAAITTAPALWLLQKGRLRSASLLLILATLITGATLDVIGTHGVQADQIKRLMDSAVIGADDPVEITGVMDRAPESTPESFYLTIRVEKLSSRNIERRASGVVELLAPIRDRAVHAEYDSLELRYGARIRVMTRLARTDNFRNPGVSSFTEYLERKGYDAAGVIKSPLLVERLDDERVFLPLAWLLDWRQALGREFEEHFSAETAGVLDAALLGNRYHLSRTAAQRFREGGTFHVLVISGLHISFIGGLVFLIARRLTKKRLFQFALSAVVLWAYAVAVGAESSVVRAALMFTLVALAPVVSRRANSLNALGAAVLLILVWRPGDLFDPSFERTALSVLAIIVLAAPLLRKLWLIGEWQPTRETPYPPACAGWVRGCCELLYWSERQWRREMANANYSYQLFKSPVASRLERYHLQWGFRHAASAVIAFALARWRPLSPTFTFDSNRGGRRTAIAAALQLGLLFALVMHPLSAARADGRLRVNFLDVGQGDAALVTMPDGTTLLIDGGGRPNFRGRKANQEAESGAAFADEEFVEVFERDARSIGEAVVCEYL